MVNIGIIGCGYWGPNLLRNFNSLSNCRVKMVAELDDSRLLYLNQKFPSVKTTQNYKDLFSNEIDAVVLATPPTTHYAMAKEVLSHKKHVLVEKPLAMNTADGQELIDLAEKNKCTLMVGHTFEFNAAVRTMKKYVQSGEVGKPYYIYSQRLNLGIIRRDVNALWNLAPHDISILLYLFEKMPVSVSARGYAFIQDKIEDLVFITLQFPDGLVGHVHVSWLDPNKVRRMTLVGSKKMVVYDDTSDAKIKIYEKGITKENINESLGRYDDFGEFQLMKFAGNVVFPKIDFIEPLSIECANFVDAITNKVKPLTDGENGLRVVRILEAAQKSLERNGQIVELSELYVSR